MKRKSILMTIVAVFFASVAWGQTWPTNIPGDGTVVTADTIYFCASTDSLYPIEFGYDVSGRRLHPSYGDWHLKAKTSSSVTVGDYDFGALKNEGAGNAFRTVGSGIGGMLFEYTAKDAQCGLAVGKNFWVYVFILPEETKTVKTLDTFMCYSGTSGQTVSIDFDKVFKEYVDLYKLAGLKPEWVSPHKTYSIKLDSVASYSLRDTLIISKEGNKASGYTCGDTIPFLYNIRVDSIARDTIPKSYTICVTDTVGDMGQRNVNLTYFKRNLPAGAYNFAKIMPWDRHPNGGSNRINLYTYTYNDCKGGNPKTIVDTLKIIDQLADDSIGIDTVIHCRTEVGTVPIIDFYDKTWYTNKPMLTITDSYWEDRGIKNQTITSQPPSADYGTKSGTTSLIGGSDLNLDDMGSNIKYFYRWNVDASVHECFVDQNGNPGWGDMIVILQDPFLAQDYTAQLCRSSYPTGKFDLNAYTGLSVTWSGNFGNTTTGTEIEPSKMMQNTYKYKYEVSGDCAEGKGVFYIKITDNIKTPKSKTVKYCLDKLPSQINLNDVLGVAVSGLEWEIVSGTSSVGLNTTGILDVTAYIAAEGKVPVKLVYQTKAAACVAAGTTVTLDFTSTL